ncbi:MAG: hypothetical protein Q9187_004818 [Circinaria calcarea]
MNAKPTFARGLALLQKYQRINCPISSHILSSRDANVFACNRFNGSLSSPSPSSAPIDRTVPPKQDPDSPADPPTLSSSRRSLRPLIYATTFLFIGLTIGQYVRFIILPPPLPRPGSPEDLVFLRVLQDDAEKLPMVQELRSRPHEWTELSVYGGLQESEKKSSMTAGAMGGSRGLGVQRIFWNEKEQRTICVVFFGGALAGWPGVTHGGTIATILQENIERLATIYNTNTPNVTQQPREASAKLDKLELEYLRPTLANRFHVIRAEINGSKNKQIRVKATLEEVTNGAICVEGTAVCTLL